MDKTRSVCDVGIHTLVENGNKGPGLPGERLIEDEYRQCDIEGPRIAVRHTRRNAGRYHGTRARRAGDADTATGGWMIWDPWMDRADRSIRCVEGIADPEFEGGAVFWFSFLKSSEGMRGRLGQRYGVRMHRIHLSKREVNAP